MVVITSKFTPPPALCFGLRGLSLLLSLSPTFGLTRLFFLILQHVKPPCQTAMIYWGPSFWGDTSPTSLYQVTPPSLLRPSTFPLLPTLPYGVALHLRPPHVTSAPTSECLLLRTPFTKLPCGSLSRKSPIRFALLLLHDLPFEDFVSLGTHI